LAVRWEGTMGSGMRAGWWWIDRWRKSTAYTDMTAAEQGIYRNLLDELWLRNGVIPSDEKILAKIGGDTRAWKKARAAVLARFVKTEDGLRNETHDSVAAYAEAQSKRQAARGRASAQGANRSTNGTFQPRTNRSTNPPSPSPGFTPLPPLPDSGATDGASGMASPPGAAARNFDNGRSERRLPYGPSDVDVDQHIRDDRTDQEKAAAKIAGKLVKLNFARKQAGLPPLTMLPEEGKEIA